MNTRYLLLGTALLLGAGCFLRCNAQTPAPLPPPVFVAPKAKPVEIKPAPAVAAKPTIVWCPACRGRKTIGTEVEGPCRTCTGTGKTVSGFAKTESACSFCKGNGKVLNIVQQPCTACQSKGVLDAALFEQFVACTNCNGEKVLEMEATGPCTTCNGSGKVTKSTGASMGSKSGKSGGKGFGSSLGANAAAQEQPCPFCGATGTVTKKVRKACPVCHGAGVVPPPPPPPAPSAGG